VLLVEFDLNDGGTILMEVHETTLRVTPRRSAPLPSGCDAHELLHSGGWHALDELGD
jgi:hypothetical protein